MSESSIEWIKQQAEEIGLEYNFKKLEAPGLFAIWLTWRGTNQSLPSILLNSHIDVVPVDLVFLENMFLKRINKKYALLITNFQDKWSHNPYAAEEDENGNIYARGSQDMKSIAVQYLEAVRNLKSSGIIPLRNVHISFVPGTNHLRTYQMNLRR